MFTLEKKPGRDFVLLNLSDPQLATENWEEGNEARRILTGTVTELLERVKPLDDGEETVEALVRRHFVLGSDAGLRSVRRFDGLLRGTVGAGARQSR